MIKATRRLIAPLVSVYRAHGGGIGLRGRGVLGVRQALRVLALICVVLMAVIGFNPRPALAATSRQLVKTFGSFSAPSGIAIDQTKGNVLVADGGLSETVDIFGPEGEAPSGVSVTEIPGFNFGNEPSGVAVDDSASSPSKGAVYVTDVRNNSVKKFALNASHEYELQEELNASPGFGEPLGVAVNASGDVFVGDYGSQSIVEFSPTGVELQRISTAATVRQPSAVTLDATGDLYVQGYTRGDVYEYIANSAGEVTSGSSTRQVVEQGATGITFDSGSETLYVAMRDHLAAYSASGALEGEFGYGALGSTQRLVVDGANDDLYVVDGAKADVAVFGAPVIVPGVAISLASNVTGTKATLNGSVNPEGIEVESCTFEYGTTTAYGHTAPCDGSIPADSEQHPVTANVAGLEADGVTYHYRILARNANGVSQSADKTLTTAATTFTEAATKVGVDSATLNGTVRPEGRQYSECDFEYKLATESAYKDAPCNPPAANIEPDFTAHAVDASLPELQANATYEFRLKATTAAGAIYGEFQKLTTTGPPQISEVHASDATQGAVYLEAKINPSGFGTSYHFEWGSTPSYGHEVPSEFEPYIGNGNEPVLVRAKLTGLTVGGTYHYRVVATNSAEGTSAATSADQEVETLNACGLPDDRCLEMVSPQGARVVALPLQQTAGFEWTAQAAEAPGRMAFETESGFPGTAAGGESLYLANRAAAGWQSDQYTPPMTGSAPGSGDDGQTSRVVGLSADINCGLVASSLPLTADPAGRAIEQERGDNLYRRGPEGDYTLITNLPPDPLEKGGGSLEGYELAGMSQDCRRVVFTTRLTYPGIPGVGAHRLYEWDGGVLKNIGWVPDGAGEAVAEATAGNASSADSDPLETNTFNAVSATGDRTFFTATSQTGNDSGNRAVFVRLDGTETLDVSQSPFAPDTGAEFQGATPDGTHVYFTANAGLTENSSPSGRDLYECHVVENVDTGKPGCELNDLSVGATAEPADVGAPVSDGIGALAGVSDDGSRVYFIARGQLVPGEGASGAENRAGRTMSLYLYEAASESLRYVGVIGDGDSEISAVTTGLFRDYTSRTSPDGRYLLFESAAKVTAYDSGHALMAYLFDAEAPDRAESVTCVSCRPDGKPGVGVPGVNEHESAPLKYGGRSKTYQAQSLVTRDGQPVVFFRSRDALAPGAHEGEWSLYEWAHHQVFQIAADLGRGGSPADPGGAQTLQFLGASSEGADLYFVDAVALNWEDPDARRAVWDARVGGGFAQPAPTPVCDASAEGSCQGPSLLVSSLSGSSASAAFSGPGNLAAPPPPRAAILSAAQIRARHLADALRSCRKDKKKSKRLSCERGARRKYGPKPKPKSTAKAKAKRTGGK
jgi:hypothetical protein